MYDIKLGMKFHMRCLCYAWYYGGDFIDANYTIINQDITTTLTD